ncbi:TPA: recombinase family protein [Enterococcus faecium]|uniref:recombinase family protein n=2 Tax=Enterococcus faecium TaxID=1352 RepID=UPI000B64DD65|nr:recombinase family protein [Enterococcus faecium]MDQ8242403.1 recombinase family protein [Enterococcus faecium]MDQ8244832.1 recombinase family protein [Enterococcus faecium]MDQ8301583.1 recombinase family protein [Enterococcus faecium]MDQ8586221.1 recombinase family protein [Enterococcus faecium]OTO59240.1 resolvase [Enterococcus faecium]
MMQFIRKGDIVVVTELKRLGRNNKKLTETMNLIQLKKNVDIFVKHSNKELYLLNQKENIKKES